MAVRLNLVYVDGQEESLAIRPLGLVAAERQFGSGASNGHSMEAMLYAAWYLKGKPAGAFDEWLATVDEIKENDEETRPLDEAPSLEQSPT